MSDRITDPQQIKVQMNVMVPFWMREELRRIAKTRKVSLNSMLVGALDAEFFQGETRKMTSKAGATR
jgi:hypothetical protein